MPPALFPGDGFSPTGSPWDRKYSLKSLIKCTVCSNRSLFSQRFIRIVSAPNISGTSVSTLVPPCAIRKSENIPSNGLAVIPEKPSEPPHFSPTRSSDKGTSVRSSLDALAYKSRRISIPSSYSSPTFWVTMNFTRS